MNLCLQRPTLKPLSAEVIQSLELKLDTFESDRKHTGVGELLDYITSMLTELPNIQSIDDTDVSKYFKILLLSFHSDKIPKTLTHLEKRLLHKVCRFMIQASHTRAIWLPSYRNEPDIILRELQKIRYFKDLSDRILHANASDHKHVSQDILHWVKQHLNKTTTLKNDYMEISDVKQGGYKFIKKPRYEIQECKRGPARGRTIRKPVLVQENHSRTLISLLPTIYDYRNYIEYMASVLPKTSRWRLIATVLLEDIPNFAIIAQEHEMLLNEDWYEYENIKYMASSMVEDHITTTTGVSHHGSHAFMDDQSIESDIQTRQRKRKRLR